MKTTIFCDLVSGFCGSYLKNQELRKVTWELILQTGVVLGEAQNWVLWPRVKSYSTGITNYLYPAVKRKAGLTALVTAAVSPRAQHHEVYV